MELSFQEASALRKQDLQDLAERFHNHPWQPEDHGKRAVFYNGAFCGFVNDDTDLDNLSEQLVAGRTRTFLRTHAMLVGVVGVDVKNAN